MSRSSEKNAVRAQIKRDLAALTPEQRATKSAAIITRFFNRLKHSPIQSLMAYSSFGNEIDTAALLAECLNRKIKLLLPRLIPNTQTMHPVIITNLSRDLIPHPLGFMEPRIDAPALDPKSPIDLIVVPGLAFDYSGNRLGRGTGFYDRFLESLPTRRAPRYAFAFELQIIDDVPVDPHDQPVDCIVTEDRIIVAQQPD